MATKPADSAAKDAQGTRIKWDDTGMKSSYANVCNVTSTREEVVMLFGINQAWNRGQKEVTIQLTDRIIISPYAANTATAQSKNTIARTGTSWERSSLSTSSAGMANAACSRWPVSSVER